ncbi:hypothetical protein M9458_035123, partial [Cirrhinus mrigala]
DQPGADVGPLISPQAKERVNSLIQSGVDEGAKVLLDGRNVKDQPSLARSRLEKKSSVVL